MVTQVSQSESKRLKVLWQYDVLDTVPEEVFDDLTELAARICEAPVAMISLVDEDRQWFKSKVGVTMNETSRDVSFCAHAIRQEGLFIIADATKDQRFAHNPLVISDPKIRFYAGAPLITPDGYALGTLCVLDKVPRSLRSDQRQALLVLARHVMTQLELRRHAGELAEAHKARAASYDELGRRGRRLRSSSANCPYPGPRAARRGANLGSPEGLAAGRFAVEAPIKPRAGHHPVNSSLPLFPDVVGEVQKHGQEGRNEEPDADGPLQHPFLFPFHRPASHSGRR